MSKRQRVAPGILAALDRQFTRKLNLSATFTFEKPAKDTDKAAAEQLSTWNETENPRARSRVKSTDVIVQTARGDLFA